MGSTGTGAPDSTFGAEIDLLSQILSVLQHAPYYDGIGFAYRRRLSTGWQLTRQMFLNIIDINGEDGSR